MIHITDKHNCCGCDACVQRCPKHCITMQIDNEGFYYPQVDLEACIHCSLCEKVCPIINQDAPRLPVQCVAATGKQESIVKNSSSAGIFFLLAERTIQKRGVVFGARFNKVWDVVHSWADTIEGIKPFMTSKYVQSHIGDSYKQAESFLKEGRDVLFSGTPCQIAGLKHFLRKEYDNLLCVDVVCHGVPSPGVWREYLKYAISPKGRKNTVSSLLYSPLSEGEALQIKGISFRDKSLGWKKYSFVLLSSQGESRSEENSVSSSYKTIVRQKHYYNLYMKMFLSNLTLRYSCFACPARKGKSGSDILLGDYWGIARYYPELFDQNGVSMALAYTEKGRRLLKSLNLNIQDIKYSETSGNSNIETDEPCPSDRGIFFEDFRSKRVKAMKIYNKKYTGNPIKVYGKVLINKIKMLFQ